ncbi:hypothetical protein Csa_013240 [Cucumis sativus]|uniref:Uncharacterized protein n=1 Tax=Cucumis sativus TaxID=3659 RepID=A0A0A0LRU3_CUCSA|nr:hypothetical protein Csa_013240 [Cucumis sativus]
MGYHNGQKRVQCSMAANNTGVPTDHNREDEETRLEVQLKIHNHRSKSRTYETKSEGSSTVENVGKIYMDMAITKNAG